MESNSKENKLEKSSLSYLENSQFLISDTNIPTSNNEQQIDFQKQLQDYHNQMNQSDNQNNKYHFEYTGQQIDNESNNKNQILLSNSISNITFGGPNNSLSLGGSLNIPLSKTQMIKPKQINLLAKSQIINQKGISLDKSALLNSSLMDLSNSMIIKKKNIFITKNPYVGFINNYGDNSCYINVVLHLFHYMKDINNILKDIYQIEEIKKENTKDNIYTPQTNTGDTTTNPFKEELLSNFGEILNEYEFYLDKKNCVKQVTILNTTKLRENLDKYSDGIFSLNYVADPVELLLYILDILNINYNDQVHNNFYLNLVDRINCSKKCSSSMRVRFDKDNFSYHIYVDELLNFIRNEGIKFKDSVGNLFELTMALFKDEIKVCEKCSVLYEKYLFCFTTPKYLLINCVWKNQVPEQKDILDFLFLLSAEEDLNRLFMCNKNPNSNTTYHLEGMILYSYSLCHYMILLYDKKNKVFVFHNDDIVIEYKTLYECFSQIFIDNINLYDNDKAYFYPTMLFYSNEPIYDKKDIELNSLSDYKYVEMLNKIEENQKNYIKRHTLTEEQKKKNLEELIQKQKEYEQQKFYEQNKINNESKKIENKIINKINKDNNEDYQNNENQIYQSTKLSESKLIQKYEKISGNDLLNIGSSQTQFTPKNQLNLESDKNTNNNYNNQDNIEIGFLMDIQQQSNEMRKINKPKTNMISSQRMQMKNDFDNIEDNNLARTQIIPEAKYIDNLNRKINQNNQNNKKNLNNNDNKNKINPNDHLGKSYQIINNNISQPFNEQSILNQYHKDLGKSQQIYKFNNKK